MDSKNKPKIVTQVVLNTETGELTTKDFKEIIQRKRLKGGFRMVYKSYNQAVEETISSSNELKILNVIVEEFTYMKTEVHLSKGYISKKTESSESSANRVLMKMIKNEILMRVRRGVYRLNPTMYIPFRADGESLQKEWKELKDKENAK